MTMPTMDLPVMGLANASPAVPAREEPFPVPGTPEWAEMNRRRCLLIDKKHDEGLSPEEASDLERLQRGAMAALHQVFPAPTGIDEELERIEARLRAEGKEP